MSSDATNPAAGRSGQSAGQFAASLVTSIVVFAVQVLAFLLIKDRLARIYQPRTFLVPPRERTKTIAPGWWRWIGPVLSTSNSEFVEKCGLDAYFFLRYLRTLLKIFVPAAFVILPILLPLNAADGRGPKYALEVPGTENVTGLDQLAWGNIRPTHTGRYWAHWLLALALIVYVCYIAFDELRNYIRMRQAYITSPQHRLRASATTVLVSAIPEKWLTVEALDGLYDVFPGGLRNIWINRNFDELSAKVKQRDSLASALEAAETALIKKCYKAHRKAVEKAEKEAGKSMTKAERKNKDALQNQKGMQQAQGPGLQSGDPHQVRHTLREALDGEDSGQDSAQEDKQQHPDRNVPILGEGIHALGQGFNFLGRGIVHGIRGVNRGFMDKVDTSNGFIAHHDPAAQHDHHHRQGVAFGHEHEHETARIMAHDASLHDASPVSQGEFERSSHGTRHRPQSDNDQIPLNRVESKPTDKLQSSQVHMEKRRLSTIEKIRNVFGANISEEEIEVVDYPPAFNSGYDQDGDGAIWKKYIEAKDRDNMRLPIFGWTWMPSLPLIGKKVDTIYHCRKEVARLNVEIEDDQAHPERFPLMNSAFIQFNHQVAAHMACQAVSHHLPKQMAPRVVEIDPNDVIWDNMSMPWWQIYLRTACVVSVVVGMIVLWAIPVAFTSALSQLSVAAASYDWLRWILKAPPVILSILQGVLSPALLGLLMFLLPVVLRLLSRIQGCQSGVMVELSVQKYYFFFLFVQIFLVVTVASSVVTFIGYIKNAGATVKSIPNLLAVNIPRASNYFFSYMILQALSVSAGALVQVGSLIGWYILAPLFDQTARAKFVRQTELSDIQWGTFFPVYTNLACIGLIYSVISPLILVFNIITFALFWFVYRYQSLYVTKFDLDTGGLLFPNAINTTFVGVYVMEIALIGMFFLIRDENNNVACSGQAIGMIIILILTAGYHFLLNEAFSPLFRYLPITLEDDAVKRDEEFARAMRSKYGHAQDTDDASEDIEDQLERNEKDSMERDRAAERYEMQKVQNNGGTMSQPLDLQNPEVNLDVDREHRSLAFVRNAAQRTAGATIGKIPGVPSGHRGSSWADRSNTKNRRSAHFDSTSRHYPRSASNGNNVENPQAEEFATRRRSAHRKPRNQVLDKINNFNPITGNENDLEAQQKARDELADALFSGVSDELEDLTPEERDELVQRAFQHAALRSKRPVIWIPRDELGVSDDEVIRLGEFSRNLWVSNVRQGLDAQGRTVYSGAPPDFSEIDVIRL